MTVQPSPLEQAKARAVLLCCPGQTLHIAPSWRGHVIPGEHERADGCWCCPCVRHYPGGRCVVIHRLPN